MSFFRHCWIYNSILCHSITGERQDNWFGLTRTTDISLTIFTAIVWTWEWLGLTTLRATVLCLSCIWRWERFSDRIMLSIVLSLSSTWRWERFGNILSSAFSLLSISILGWWEWLYYVSISAFSLLIAIGWRWERFEDIWLIVIILAITWERNRERFDCAFWAFTSSFLHNPFFDFLKKGFLCVKPMLCSPSLVSRNVQLINC